jgi:hypothetical protein
MAILKIVEANQPMVLIAQPHRSGGTLLAQLLDGHPQLHGHPPELNLGPAWPSLDLTKPAEELFKAIQEKHLVKAFGDGYHKDGPARKLGLSQQVMSFPLVLRPKLHAKLFLRLAAQRGLKTQRDVLDCYFTSLYSGWQNYANVDGVKRWIVAFRGRYKHDLDRFFADYPDGRTMAIIRDCKAVIASKSRYDGEMHADGLQRHVRGWNNQAKSRLVAKASYGDRMFLMTYERLIGDPEGTMRKVADWLGIAFDPILLTPTFNHSPIKANSSFEVADVGVQTTARENWRKVFSEQEAAEIDGATAELYNEVERRSDA